MADIEVEFTDEEYAQIEQAAKSLGMTIEDYVDHALREVIKRIIRKCQNCGADAMDTKDGVKHLRSHAKSCDLDDPSSLVATI
jgi:hypothetical protein